MSTLTITDSSEPTLSSKKAQILQIANHQKWHIIWVNKCKKKVNIKPKIGLYSIKLAIKV